MMIGDIPVQGAKRDGYHPLDAQTLPAYLAKRARIAAQLGGIASQWHAREMGDGNLNLVFLVRGPAGSVVVKQALPYVRMVGTSWPLPLSRSHFEHAALQEQAACAEEHVPVVYDDDPDMALIVMEHLESHVVVRKALLGNVLLPQLGAHVGRFLARTLYRTSDLNLCAVEKKAKMSAFLPNTAMCRISEDLIFDEPYFAAPMNRHTSPQLDAAAAALRQDLALKVAAQEMKWCFHNCPEALLHGDLHTGSLMATLNDTRVIDPEFACYGPMAFDVGMILGNFLLAYWAHAARTPDARHREAYAAYLRAQTRSLWHTFSADFLDLASARNAHAAGGDICHPRLCVDSPELAVVLVRGRLEAIWRQAVGFAGCEIIRRVVGLAHVEDFESIRDADRRARGEAAALEFARDLLVNRARHSSIDSLVDGLSL